MWPLAFPDRDIYVRDRCTCQYCGMSATDDFDKYRHLCIDHIVPLTKGGASDDANKAVACRRCNELLGNAMPDGAGREEKIAWKRRTVAEKNAVEYQQYQHLRLEITFGAPALCAESL